MAASKIFGHWAASLASEWSQRRLTDLRSTLEEFIDRLECVQGVDDLEVQERASTTLQLLRFIQAEIKSHNAPPDPSADGPDMPNAFADGNVSYPKSLYLISPLFSAYEMNPVSVKAQELVPVPEGLDLNAVLVAPSAYALGQDDDEWEVASDRDDQVDLGSGGGAGMEELRRVIREGEAKDKKSGSKSKKKRNENETEEERKAVSPRWTQLVGRDRTLTPVISGVRRERLRNASGWHVKKATRTTWMERRRRRRRTMSTSIAFPLSNSNWTTRMSTRRRQRPRNQRHPQRSSG